MKAQKLLLVLMLWLFMASVPAAWGILAGCNPDIHMDIQGVIANDFHMEGRIKSGFWGGNWSMPPILVHHVDGGFPDFSYSIMPDYSSAGQNEFIFKADWKGRKFQYCEVLHLGLLFDLECHNLVIDLVGWWTRDGERIREGQNGGTVLIPGFDVMDFQEQSPQKIQFRNDSHLLGRGISGKIMQLELARLKASEVEERFGSLVELFDELREGGRQAELPWIPVGQVFGQGEIVPINEKNPADFQVDSFFDVFVEIDLSSGGGFATLEPMPLEPGDILISRVGTEYPNNAGEPDFRWTWHMHESHRLDFGDAPEIPIMMSYPTTLVNNGARHIIQGPWLGDWTDRPDPEPDGQPEPQALGDDNWDGNDDEDGVKIPVLSPGVAATITLEVNGPGGWVDAWIDFDQNQTWSDPAERIFGNWLPAGVHNITVTPPAVTIPGQTFARFRIHLEQGNLPPYGLARSGEVEDHLVNVKEKPDPRSDLGDAPDSTNSWNNAAMLAYPGVGAHYPTVFAAGSPPHGPKHWSPQQVAWLGQQVTLEDEADLPPDQDPTTNIIPLGPIADKDLADDGVIFPIVVRNCRYNRFQYIVTVVNPLNVPLYTNVWFDWNKDGDWDDVLTCPDGTAVDEWAVQNQQLLLGPGVHTITTPPFLALVNSSSDTPDMWMRITLAERKYDPTAVGAGMLGYGGAGPSSGYKIGETEDYLFVPEIEPEPEQYDFGDAPDKVDPTGVALSGYHTLLINDGARHLLGGKLFLGSLVDAEPDGQPNAPATGDDDNPNTADDEDGVKFLTWPLLPGRPATVEVVSTEDGLLSAWIDFDGDGTWTQSVDQIFNDVAVSAGTNTLTFIVPLGSKAPQRTYARFRVSKNGGLGYRGPAPDGEVEDYLVLIQRRWGVKWLQMPDVSPFGIDICLDGNDDYLRTIADDFQCTNIDRITDVHLWGSWKGDVKGKIRKIHLSIHSDDPVGPGGSDKDNIYSKPDKLLWQWDVYTGLFREKVYARLDKGEYWWDPVKNELIPAGDKTIWQIDIRIPPRFAFIQEGTPEEPVIYWLDVQVEAEDGEFGWKTRRWPRHFNDDAVLSVDAGPWKELRYPNGHPYRHLMFEDLVAGDTYLVGDTFVSSGVAIDVKPFQWSSGIWTNNGRVTVDAANMAGGTGLELNCNNANVAFNFPTLYNLDLMYGDYGGNVNLSINGDFRNVNDLSDLNGMTVGGVLVTVLPNPSGVVAQGILHLDGVINNLMIGGQEFWIDNVGSGSIDMAFAITDRAFVTGTADIDANGYVDLQDFRIMSAEWLTWPE